MTALWNRARDARRRVVGYVRVHPGEDVATSRTPAGAFQTRAIDDWAFANDAGVVTTAVDRVLSGVEHAADRVGFLQALAVVRDGKADAICVATLAYLDEEPVMQEFLLCEARKSGVPVVSTSAADAPQLADPPADAARALVRRVLAEWPAFQGEMRAVRAWARRSGAELEELAPVLVQLESLQEQGLHVRALDAARARFSVHRLASRLRARRL